jgi:hypothetical protein
VIENHAQDRDGAQTVNIGPVVDCGLGFHLKLLLLSKRHTDTATLQRAAAFFVQCEKGRTAIDIFRPAT